MAKQYDGEELCNAFHDELVTEKASGIRRDYELRKSRNTKKYFQVSKILEDHLYIRPESFPKIFILQQ